MNSVKATIISKINDIMHEGATAEESSNGIGSGRYRLGSGNRPYQRSERLSRQITKLLDKGDTEKLIKYTHKMTKSEIERLVEINEARNVAISSLYGNNGNYKPEKFMQKVNKYLGITSEMSTNAAKIYNSYKVMSSLYKTDKIKINAFTPSLGGSGGGGSKKEKK